MCTQTAARRLCNDCVLIKIPSTRQPRWMGHTRRVTSLTDCNKRRERRTKVRTGGALAQFTMIPSHQKKRNKVLEKQETVSQRQTVKRSWAKRCGRQRRHCPGTDTQSTKMRSEKQTRQDRTRKESKQQCNKTGDSARGRSYSAEARPQARKSRPQRDRTTPARAGYVKQWHTLHWSGSLRGIIRVGQHHTHTPVACMTQPPSLHPPPAPRLVVLATTTFARSPTRGSTLHPALTASAERSYIYAPHVDTR